jgi:hypothetical protein
MQTYDPHQLISDVRATLRAAGISPNLAADEKLTMTGACMLLRGLGIFPGTDAVSAYKRILDSESWPDTDDRSGDEYRQRAAFGKAR